MHVKPPRHKYKSCNVQAGWFTYLTAVLTKLDHAKYPFTNEAAEYVKSLNIDLNDLAGEEFSVVLDLAEKRIVAALTVGKIDPEPQGEPEILAYPTALMFIALAGDERARRRYALGESKRAYELLRQESSELLMHIAKQTFGWNARLANREIGETLYEFGLSYPDYLRNAVRIRDPDWKLTNRVLEQGYVYCDKDEFARLLKEEIEARVLSRITGQYGSVPEAIAPRVERIRKLVVARAQMYGVEETPKAVLTAAMPPCMKALLSYVSTGKHVPHIGRFAMTAFLSNIGVTDEEIIKMFRSQSDFSDRIARYQVEHISGSRGGKKKYTPPSCKTMKTHSICINPDQLCATISHPLSYYRKKARMITAATRRQRTAQPPRPGSS
jgi:DNA primase large subunit